MHSILVLTFGICPTVLFVSRNFASCVLIFFITLMILTHCMPINRVLHIGLLIAVQ